MSKQHLDKQHGFSLVEMMVTLALMAILVLAITPNLQREAKHQREMILSQDLRDIREAIDNYKKATLDGHIAVAIGESGYPPSLRTLVDGVVDARNPNGNKIYFLKRIPRDPFNTNTYLSAEATWQLRSYESSADQPRPGDDVFDIRSRSSEVGLNGIPYKDW